MRRIVALITDFGEGAFYVGQMKAVIKSISPFTEIVDITHSIPKFNIDAGQFVLLTSYKYFPKGTIFCTVVDPGVGSERKAVAIYSEGYYFVGPDNGIFGFLNSYEAYEVEVPKHASATFHGRDVFAVVSAKLSLGIPLEELGCRIRSIEHRDVRDLKFGDSIVGRIVLIDDFGNLITNIHKVFFRKGYMQVGNEIVDRFARTFSDVSKGDKLFYIGSMDFLEVAVREGNAKKVFNVSHGDEVKLIPKKDDIVDEAFYFAVFKHANQKRKFKSEPYMAHIVRTAELLANYTDDTKLLCSAYLHDVLEDTDTSYDELENRFGREIAQTVLKLSTFHVKDWSKLDRESLLVKLCDVLDNVQDSLDAPKSFTYEYFRRIYIMLEEVISRKDLESTHYELAYRIKHIIDSYTEQGNV